MTGKLEHSPERWARMKPEAVAAGSQAQIYYALRDAIHDIRVMAEALELIANPPQPRSSILADLSDAEIAHRALQVKAL